MININFGKHIKKENLVFAAILLLYAVVFISISFFRVDTLKTYLNDLGNMDQAVWSTLKGNFLHQSNTFDGTSLVRFYEHFDPILLIFVPFYFLLATPKWLLLFQTVAIIISAIPIFLLARKRLGPVAGLLLVTGYLLLPALENANLYDFHPFVLAVPVIAWMLYGVLEQRWKLYWLMAILLIFIKEDMSLVLAATGMYLLVSAQKRHGLVSLSLGLCTFLIIMKVMIPHFSPLHAHPLLSAGSNAYGEGYSARYAWLGSSLEEMGKTIFQHPLFVIKHLLTPERFLYVSMLLIPLVMLPLFSALSIVALPTLAINLLSANPMMHSLYFYHSAILSPVLVIASILVLEKIKSRAANWYKPLLLATMGLTIVAHITQGLMPYSLSPYRYEIPDFSQDTHYAAVKKLKELIPPGASVSVQQNLGIFLSQRYLVYRFPLKAPGADYVVVDFYNPYHGDKKEERFDYTLQMSRKSMIAKLTALTSEYGVILFESGCVVLKKGHINSNSVMIIKIQAGQYGFER